MQFSETLCSNSQVERRILLGFAVGQLFPVGILLYLMLIAERNAALLLESKVTTASGLQFMGVLLYTFCHYPSATLSVGPLTLMAIEGLH